MSTIRLLTDAAYGTHFADQTALVAVPLIAALVFDASPAVIGALAACQSMAHLLGSLPFGVLVDQKQLRKLAIASALIATLGFSGASLSILWGTIIGFGLTVTAAGFGAVLFVLTALSILPKSVPPEGLAKANSAIEIPRALCSFIVPLGVGLAISTLPAWTFFATASLAALLALSFTLRLPTFEVTPVARQPIAKRIWDGGRYVVGHALLLPISICAVFWNLAFAALLVVLVPALTTLFFFDPGAFGIALSAFGLAAIAGTWLIGRLANRIAPAVILLFGPGSTALAAFGLLMIGPETPVFALYLCIFIMGFGPAMWLITQNSVRQLVTPPALLGRVNAVIQTAIYGIRPLGALLGGFITSFAGPWNGLLFVAIAFGLSFATALFSPLRSVRAYEVLRPEPS